MIGPLVLLLLTGAAFMAVLLLSPGDAGPAATNRPGIAAPAATVVWQDLASPQQAVGGRSTVRETFDAFPIDSGAPSGWTTSGGGSVAIAPLPTSADRSLRLTTGSAGEVTEVCMNIAAAPRGPIGVSVDVLQASAIPPGTALLTMSANSSPTAEVRVGPTGALVLATGDGSLESSRQSPMPALGSSREWLHVALTVTTPADALCLHSPAGGPSIWIAVDNVSVTL